MELDKFVIQISNLKLKMQSSNRKDDIIIEIGSQWLRMGLVGQKVPRKSIRSKGIIKILKDPSNTIQNQMLMDQLLCNIFFIFLNSSCQGKTVILLEKVYTQRFVLQLMGCIMFKKLKIQKLQLCLSCVTPLYLTGRYTGIVISSGNSCTEIMPLYDGYPLFRNYAIVQGGTNRLVKIIKEQLIMANPEHKELLIKLSDEEVSDIKNTYGRIPAIPKDLVIPVKRIKLKLNQSKINYEILFGDYQNQEPNIAYSFLKMINQVPISCLFQLCRNVLFAGGLWRVQGMQNLFKRKVLQILKDQKTFPTLTVLEVKKMLNFVSWGFNPSEVAWIGCSIGASVKNIEHLSLTKAQFQEKGYIQKIMESYFLSG